MIFPALVLRPAVLFIIPRERSGSSHGPELNVAVDTPIVAPSQKLAVHHCESYRLRYYYHNFDQHTISVKCIILSLYHTVVGTQGS